MNPTTLHLGSRRCRRCLMSADAGCIVEDLHSRAGMISNVSGYPVSDILIQTLFGRMSEDCE